MQQGSQFITLEMAASALKRDRPSLLAEIARQISSVLVPESEFNPATICAMAHGQRDPKVTFTYGAIGDYLQQAATGKHVPVLFHALEKTLESSRVLVNTDWLKRRMAAADESLRLSQRASESAANSISQALKTANVSTLRQLDDQPPPMSPEGHKNLLRLLAHKNNDWMARQKASELEIAIQELRKEAENKDALLAVVTAERDAANNTIHLLTLENTSKDRVIQDQRLKIEHLTELKTEPPKETNVHRRNSGIREAKLAAQALATDLWKTEEFKGLTVGLMAKEVFFRMIMGEHKNRMPDTPETVAKWLKEGEVPSHSRKPV